MIEWCKDNPAVVGLFGFFAFIFLVQGYQDSCYKRSLPIAYHDAFTAEEKQQIRKSIEWQLLAWQGDFGDASRFANVIVRRECFQDSKGVWLSGQCKERTITVYAGQYMEVPSFYHELCHLNIDTTNEHSDPRWPSWERRNDEICRFAIASRQNSPSPGARIEYAYDTNGNRQ